jgi:hypothetical protein
MNTKTLSTRALSVIDQYLRFKVGNAVCSVPYFNNKAVRARAALRANIGKGSPKDIFDEMQTLIVRQHISLESLTDESLKKLMAENNIGIDCSAFAYYVLNAESEESGKGSIDRHLSFTSCRGIIGKIRCSLRPAENCDVATFAHDKNGKTISITDVLPGDYITMTGGPDQSDRDHILVIHQVEYQNGIPIKIHYSHIVAYWEDRLYGSGIRQGEIEITNPAKSIVEQRWTGENSENIDRISARAKTSRTEIRRLRRF